ncbi:hypothetical protein HS1genome_0203 [Sulfodiicoccus acidiphilus]|uniref:Heavy-metal chelation domain-containing protein n=2 Tax=Sulfodiicoccus acidiphilus TaxID=1670455 RepID=A0A348B0W2_9CREN|nr:hypothetical protein HS1genome_0203 [Sulfodiicoccus acidiphilus]GGT99352.1 hypothetical protein GCM10007116_15960 [Sulfodiicoccus acidiphilus]
MGVNYTSAVLDDRSVGISNTIYDKEYPLGGKLAGMSAYDAASALGTSTERSVATAIMNALTVHPFGDQDPTTDSEGRLCVFGYSPNFHGKKFNKIYIYDFNVREEIVERNVVLRPYSMFKGESCEVAVLFGSTLVNGTVDDILSKLSSDILILAGISAIYAPLTLKRHGFTHVLKYFLSDRFTAFRVVCEGGGSDELRKYIIRKYKKI